jgi:putative chitinase
MDVDWYVPVSYQYRIYDMIRINERFLYEFAPECKRIAAELAEPLNDVFSKFEINTLDREAAFLAQTAHESVRFGTLVENLNYSVKGLLRVFPNYFTTEQAQEYAHKPMRIASHVYAGRLGNRDEASGDGWTYRGRGLIQITGVSNYRKCGKGLVDDPEFFLRDPDKLGEVKWAVRSAGWFWDSNRCNELADVPDEQHFRKLTRRINGGLHGIQDRLYLWERARSMLERLVPTGRTPEAPLAAAPQQVAGEKPLPERETFTDPGAVHE